MLDDPPNSIPRSAKGKRPQYFEDPASDKLHFMIMALVEELSVTRDRLDALERVLDRKGISAMEDVDTFAPSEEDEATRASRRSTYVAKIMKCFEDEVAQVKRADPAIPFDDVVKAVAE